MGSNFSVTNPADCREGVRPRGRREAVQPWIKGTQTGQWPSWDPATSVSGLPPALPQSQSRSLSSAEQELPGEARYPKGLRQYRSHFYKHSLPRVGVERLLTCSQSSNT